RHADDRIDRARAYAQVAADAERLVYAGDAIEARAAAARVERQRIAPEQRREPLHRLLAARRAAIDVGRAAGDRRRVRPAAWIAALAALDPRQQPLDALRQVVAG